MPVNKSSLSALLALGVLGFPEARAAGDVELEAVLITAQRAERVSRGATGLNLDIKDTPQSISVVTEELMQDFGLHSINDALEIATGINVEDWETNRTNYTARGFEIQNTQIDGVGMPNGWGIVTGAQDAFGFEKLEVIRGANGLLTGVGNASGTLNYVRKRPTNDRRGAVNLSGGSWNTYRAEADFSTPLTENEAWAVRVVAAYEDKDSWLRDLHDDRLFLYGVVDGQIGARTTLTAGYSIQDANTTGNMWGALTLSNSDGTQAEFPASASTTQDWTLWDTMNHSAFVEVGYALADDWQLKGTYNYREASEHDKLFFAYSYTGLDPETNLGLVGWPGRYAGSSHAHLGELSVSGRFAAFGRDHELMFGVSQSSSGSYLDYWPVDADEPAMGPLPAFPYGGDAIAEPEWGERTENDHGGQWMTRAFAATRLVLTDRVKTVLGFNQVRFHRQGVSSFGSFYEQTESELSPYAGVTVDLNDAVLAYASYSDIYQPQDQYDINEEYLAPSRGENIELGVKAEWLGGRLLTTAAWFNAKQNGIANIVGMNENGNYYYEPINAESKGVEFEASGKLNDYTSLLLGFTKLTLRSDIGEDAYTGVPRTTANVSFSTQLPVLPQLRFGATGRWQSRTSKLDIYTGVIVDQKSYATLNLFGQWKFSDKVSLRANVDNLTDEKYMSSMQEIGFYAAPRNYSVGIDYKF